MDEQISWRAKLIESGYKSGENRADGLVIGVKFDVFGKLVDLRSQHAVAYCHLMFM